MFIILDRNSDVIVKEYVENTKETAITARSIKWLGISYNSTVIDATTVLIYRRV